MTPPSHPKTAYHEKTQTQNHTSNHTHTQTLSIIQHKRHSRSVLGKLYLLGMLLNYIFYPPTPFLPFFFSDFTLCNPFLKRFYNRWFKLNITQTHTKYTTIRVSTEKNLSLTLST
jgi:hypothetical protein